MSITIAVFALAATVVIYRALFLGARLPKPPWWATDGWVGYLFTPALMAMLTLGGGTVINAALDWNAQQFTEMHAGASGLIIAAAVWAWKLIDRWARTSRDGKESDAAPMASPPAPIAGNDIAAQQPDPAHTNSPTPRKAA